MTREEARREIDSLDFYLQNHTDDYSEESHTAIVLAIKALDQVAKLRELRKNLAEKERFYANESNDNTLYSSGLADAYCTTTALIDEILGGIIVEQ